MTSPATASDIADVLGDIDGFLVEQILGTRATVDEIVEALAAVEDEQRIGERRELTSPRAAEVRALLEEAAEEPDAEEYAS